MEDLYTITFFICNDLVMQGNVNTDLICNLYISEERKHVLLSLSPPECLFEEWDGLPHLLKSAVTLL